MTDEDHRNRLRETRAVFEAATAAVEEARQRHHEAIIDALRADLAPSEVTDLSAYKTHQVRRIGKEAGIPKGVRKKRP
jgi:hypothetical protein